MKIKDKIMHDLKYLLESIAATFIIVITAIFCIMLYAKAGLMGILLMVLAGLTIMFIIVELKIGKEVKKNDEE
jgi:hypothetical protein